MFLNQNQMKRAERRQQKYRVRQKVKRIVKSWNSQVVKEFYDNPRFLAHMVETHGKPCSCFMCGNPRKHFHQITRKEKAADFSTKEQMIDPYGYDDFWGDQKDDFWSRLADEDDDF